MLGVLHQLISYAAHSRDHDYDVRSAFFSLYRSSGDVFYPLKRPYARAAVFLDD